MRGNLEGSKKYKLCKQQNLTHEYKSNSKCERIHFRLLPIHRFANNCTSLVSIKQVIISPQSSTLKYLRRNSYNIITTYLLCITQIFIIAIPILYLKNILAQLFALTQTITFLRWLTHSGNQSLCNSNAILFYWYTSTFANKYVFADCTVFGL